MGMAIYWVNVLGLGMNCFWTILLLKFSPDTKSEGGVTVTHEWEREYFPEFKQAIKNGDVSIILLIGGLDLQLFGVLLKMP